MEIFDTTTGITLLFRWIHITAGITWIGLLYYFNFVQAPFVAAESAEVKGAVTRGLVPRALAWFRYSALVTWLMGVGIVLLNLEQIDWTMADTQEYWITILTGAMLGTIMFLNVWGVIWPNQKRIIASANAVAGGGQADPTVPDRTRRALLASRTNVVMSLAMVFFMATASHLRLFSNPESSDKFLYAIIAGAIILLVEANALLGLTGPAKKYLEKINSAIVASVVFWGVIYVVLQVVFREG